MTPQFPLNLMKVRRQTVEVAADTLAMRAEIELECAPLREVNALARGHTPDILLARAAELRAVARFGRV